MGWFGYLTLFLYYVYFLYQMYKVEESIRQNTHRQRGIGLDSSFMGRVHGVSGSGATMMDLMVYWLRKQC